MIPIYTSVEDIQKLLAYLARQVGWVESAKVEKALGGLDDRKVSAMVEFGLILRDGGNLKATPRGQLFNSGEQVEALREVLQSVELYRATLEWAHYGRKTEVTVTEVGQYWEGSHEDTLGSLRGATLKDGAVCFGRMVAGAGLGTFTLGRGGRETRIKLLAGEVESLVNGASTASSSEPTESSSDNGAPVTTQARAESSRPNAPTPVGQPTTTISTSPSVHVNVEIHIAANATADTVREIFRNMARYVLDKPVTDDVG